MTLITLSQTLKTTLIFIMIYLGSVITALAQTTPLLSDTETASSWQICNETSFILRVATAHEKDGVKMPEGWLKLYPGACEDKPIQPDFPRFIYAESSKAHQGGIREWKGQTPLCVGTTDFVADPAIECALQNFKSRNFIKVPSGEPVTRLTEPQNFRTRAETAGLQRLLKDNGYTISDIDGVTGRRTNQSMRKFLNEHELAADLDIYQKFDALEAQAFTRLKSVGVTVCNQTERKIWIALGERHKKEWRSAGWWSVNPDQCAQPLTHSLVGRDAHIFARQSPPPVNIEEPETITDMDQADWILKTVGTASQSFCVAEARFSALGRENCLDNGYGAHNFKALPNDVEGFTLNLTSDDFQSPNMKGLRR